MQSNDNTKFWRFCSSSTNSNQASYPLPMIFNNKSINSFLELPDAFNEFFSSVFRVPGQLSQLSLYLTSSYAPLLSSIKFSHTDVLAALVKVKPKFTSPDGIPGYFINKLELFISSPLTTIFNLSISMSQLPADWKHAVVSPIFKGKGSPNDVTNYRSISYTSVTDKTIESLINSCLLKHFLSNSLLSSFQFGFLPSRSTTSNLLYTDHPIRKELASGNSVDLILFDMTKAFDTVLHKNLLFKPRTKFGIVGQLHSWLRSFLYNRPQAVKVSTSCLSSTTPVTSEVIQGAPLGPILFFAYINNIVDCFLYGKPVLYADDLKIVFSTNSLHLNNSYELIKRDLHNLCLWASNNSLQFNYNKYARLHYGQSNPLFTYTLGNHIISAVQSVTDLGILRILDLSYKEHCNNLISRTNRLSANILRSFICCNPKFFSCLFVAYIHSLLKYASSVWSPNSVEIINRLEGVQRMYTKRILSIVHFSYNDRLIYLCLQRLEARRLCSDLLFLSKLKFGLTYLTLAFSVNTSRLRTNKFTSPIY